MRGAAGGACARAGDGCVGDAASGAAPGGAAPGGAAAGLDAPGPAARPAERPPFPPRLGLAAAVLAVSWAVVLIRWAQAPPLVVGAYRLGFASFLFWVAAAAVGVRPLRGWSLSQLAAAVAAAACLALHFALWIASLGFTSIASSVLLVSTQPVFVAILGRLFLKERVAARAALGIALAVAGSLAITGGNVRFLRGAWHGDLLALGGAAAIAVHYLFARGLRRTIDLLPLMAVVTPTAAALLFLAALLAGDPLAGYRPGAYGLFFLLALGPTVVGHTLLNWALRYMKAYEVNVAVLGEPLGATLLGLLVFGEQPPAYVAAGGALVLAGIALAWSPLARAAA